MKSVGTYLVENRQFVRKVGSDLLAIIPLGIGVLVLYLAGQPYKRGFNCDDESLRYPYKDNTISSAVLYVYSTFIPAITIIGIEFLIFKQNENKIQSSSASGRPSFVTFLWQIYCQLSPFVFGALISQMTTDIAKYSIGRLRPHFIDVCQPMRTTDTLPFTLDNPSQCDDRAQLRYIEDYTCTNTKYEERWRDAHLSFMSGHSSFSAFCLVYLVIYLQFRVKWTVVGFVRPLYQCCLIYLVLYTGFSRISDYKHHWSDVLIGLIQGTAVAILTTRYISTFNVNDPSVDETTTGTTPLNRNGVETELKSSRNPNYNSCKLEIEESSDQS